MRSPQSACRLWPLPLRLLPLALGLLTGAPALAAPVVLENSALRVEIAPDSGRIRVREKRGGHVWEQPAAPPVAARTVLRRASAPQRQGPAIRLSAAMVADARSVDGDRDCSGRVWLSWDDTHLYLAADITDDARAFGPSEQPVWERDSLEVWIDTQQVLLALSPQGSAAFARGTQRLEGGRIELQPTPDGYRVEAALPWAWAPTVPRPAVGTTLRLAVGINDADQANREGQLYWPRGWRHSQPDTFAEATLGDARGAAPASARHAAPVYRVVRPAAGRSVELERTFTAGADPLPLRLRFSLPTPDGADLRVEARPAAGSPALAGSIRFLEPFLLDAPRGVLAVADYCDGHLYPLDRQPFPAGWFSGDRLDMPWVGMCDLDSGRGYLLLLETSDDAAVAMQPVAGKGGRRLVAPVVHWQPEKGAFGYPRSLLYHFAARGGYVSLCQRYRAYAKAQGLVVPFTEKLKKTPHLTRLFGAPDVWGDASLAFAREARALGVEKMLINGRPGSPADMRAINELGYLTSEYDNYTDILQAEDGKIDAQHAPLPDHAVLQADGKRMGAWLTFDGKTQFMKRCPALWVPTARQVADQVLSEWPFLARFIDVTTAESLYECHDPAHPLTKREKRACGPALIRTFRERNLVMGGEHGIWWAVPVLDYIEGMQSGGSYFWPAGHLIHPKSKTEQFETPWGGTLPDWESYATWGIGHQWRAPLWQLVFHDCIVSTWYWGDASDFLLDAAPEVTAKKDAFNILHGTIPLLWADAGGSWHKDRAVFLRTYRNTCKLHEVIATAAMRSHEFLTSDHAVQRTRFSDGTTCVVNFGAKPYRVTVGGKSYLLPQNGWAVNGPRITQSLALEQGRPVTTIRAPGYTFCDRGGVPVTLRAEAPGRLRIVVEKAAAPKPTVTIHPSHADRSWQSATAAEARLYRLDARGERIDLLTLRRAADGSFRVPAQPGSLQLLWGKEARRPDLQAGRLTCTPGSPRQGTPLRATVALTNVGGAVARGVRVHFLLDGTVVHRTALDVLPGARKQVVATLDTRRVDGPRRLQVVIDPANRVAELSEQNNRREQSLTITPDWQHWARQRVLRLDAGALDRERETVVVPFALPAGADPASVRVATLDASGAPDRAVPAQLDGGELCFVLPDTLAAGETRRLAVLWNDAGSRLLPPGGSFWHDDRQAVVTPRYEARFAEGTLVFLAPRQRGVTGRNFLKSLILSSAATGWVEEPGEVQAMRVEHAGPARTVLSVRKALKADVVYEKRYTFYADRFDLEIAVNKSAGGLYSRAHYTEPCRYTDSGGAEAQVDGKGDGEDVYGKSTDPKWYAVYTPEWAHSCVALTPFEHLAYWDGGPLGAIGFVTNRTAGIRMSYVIHPGAADASFAAADYRRLTTPVAIAWE